MVANTFQTKGYWNLRQTSKWDRISAKSLGKVPKFFPLDFSFSHDILRKSASFRFLWYTSGGFDFLFPFVHLLVKKKGNISICLRKLLFQKSERDFKVVKCLLHFNIRNCSAHYTITSEVCKTKHPVIDLDV